MKPTYTPLEQLKHLNIRTTFHPFKTGAESQITVKMNFSEELEAMAKAAASYHFNKITIRRWQKLFSLSSSEAAQKIEEFRTNFNRRLVISDAHWSLVRDQMESKGFDREAYEYLLTIKRRSSRHPEALTDRQRRQLQSSTYLVKLDGPLSSIEAVARAGNIGPLSALSIIKATDAADQHEGSSFCEVNGEAKIAIEAFLSESQPSFCPTFIRYSKAQKDLSSSSLYPSLGVDSTLPQHRLHSSDYVPRPAQAEYPVWYFFYGTLADGDVLAKLLGLDPKYCPAKIRGGFLEYWGRYKALIDDPRENSIVDGKAFLVNEKEHEEALQVYETNAYEVVRCRIEMEEGKNVDGLTFRFKGEGN
jgi:hypothetical protein